MPSGSPIKQIDPADEAEILLRKAEKCCDCKVAEPTVHYFGGAKRCQPCSDSFRDANRAEEAAADKAWLEANPCEICGKQSAIAHYECQECCEHEPDADEGYHCLSCGMDCSEGAMSSAYEYAKAMRRDG